MCKNRRTVRVTLPLMEKPSSGLMRNKVQVWNEVRG